MSVRRARGAFAPLLETGIMKYLFLEKPEVCILIPIDWFDSCDDSFCAGMKLTAQESVSQL